MSKSKTLKNKTDDENNTTLVSKDSFADKPKIKKINILFVCTGNTCRSPMAEYIMKYFLTGLNKLKLYSISSAGLNVVLDDVMADNAIETLKDMGIKRKPRKARQLTEKMLNRADLVVCMTQEHKLALMKYGAKVVSLAEITGAQDVSDPYGMSVKIYKAVAEYLLYAMPDIIDYCDKMKKS